MKPPARVHAAAGRKPAWAETQKNPVARGYGNVAQQGAAEHIHHIHVFHAEIGRFQASGHADAPARDSLVRGDGDMGASSITAFVRGQQQDGGQHQAAAEPARRG